MNDMKSRIQIQAKSLRIHNTGIKGKLRKEMKTRKRKKYISKKMDEKLENFSAFLSSTMTKIGNSIKKF
jgi:hypothetical protein